jgi:hypothetical protein
VALSQVGTTVLAAAMATVLVGAVVGGCSGGASRPPVPEVGARGGPTSAAPQSSGADWFTDEASATGLIFQHFNGMSGAFYLAEIMGPGVAFIDYDNDGDLDVYVVQGQMLGSGTPVSRALIPPPPGVSLRDRLFRNDLTVDGAGVPRLRFTDVTEESGIDIRSYGMGVATGDVNNDGWTDLFLTRLGGSVLLHNNGNGTFSDVSARSGIREAGWPVSSAFVDYDRDGWLDLYVANYLAYNVATDTDCFARNGSPGYCAPVVYRPQADHLYRNRGDGTFIDVTIGARVTGESGPGLGVVTGDFTGDGWPDVYVANDGTANLLWVNQRDGTFREAGLASGAALSADGKPEGSMGVDAGDFDNDGDEDLVMTHVAGEGHNLYVNDGRGTFEDRSTGSGLGPPTMAYTGFGIGWFDADNDGWLDVLSVSGAVQVIEALVRQGESHPLLQRMQLFGNVNGRLADVTGEGGRIFEAATVARGTAFGDVDNDGDTDVLVGSNSGPLRLLVNQRGQRRHWLGVRLVGSGGRDMLGARVDILRDGAIPRITRWSRSDGSYASARDPRVLVGLGDSVAPPRVRVTWPDGQVEERGSLPTDRWHTLTQGKL